MKIKASGFPWQRVNHWSSNIDKTKGETFGWNPFKVKGMGRFGGGWAIKFGITISSDMKDIVLDLMLGSVRIKLRKE